MPPSAGDRFSSHTMADCPWCPSDGRQFRTARTCARCAAPLCLSCRPAATGEVLCPACGGGDAERAVEAPDAVISRLEAAGAAVPFWLIVLARRRAVAPRPEVEVDLIPE